MILTLSILVGLIMLGVSYWVVFRDWDDFCECISYSIQPDFYSWYKGELGEDWWAEMKVYFWLAIAAAAGYGTYVGLTAWSGP